MLDRLAAAFGRHIRFVVALGSGLAAFAAGHALGLSAALLAGGDVFYGAFLGLSLGLTAGQSAGDLRRRAQNEDEGVGIVLLIIVATMLFFVIAVFEALAGRRGGEIAPLVLAGLGAPLGWLVLHATMAFRYADLHYFEDPGAPAGESGNLDFPGGGEPGPWDFLYFSFVIGMTCQVSDVAVRGTRMRRTVLWHGLVSFFFNTVFIAMAVNAAVATAA
jgi:uncharacterized membrane protein